MDFEKGFERKERGGTMYMFNVGVPCTESGKGEETEWFVYIFSFLQRSGDSLELIVGS